MKTVGEDLFKFINKFPKYNMFLKISNTNTRPEYSFHVKNSSGISIEQYSVSGESITDVLPIYNVKAIYGGYIVFINDNGFIELTNRMLEYH